MSERPSVDPLFLAFQEAVAGQFALQREIGRGGMGVVYLARDVRLDRSVAIKLLPPEFAATAKLRDRFTREARTAARLSHPYIVPIHSVDEAGGFVFYVMAYVDGETLAQRVMSRGPLPPAEATRVLREVAWALAYAHSQGVVHRDVKPANILLERGTERAMVTDFGIARLAHASGETMEGELLGTPEYMSPEQASGETVDGRSDIYSLGIVAYYAVSGSLPFTAPTPQAVLAKQITEPALSVASAARGTPHSLAAAIDACLHKDPAQRMPSGDALADALAPALIPHAEVPLPVRAFLDSNKMATLAWYPVLSLTSATVFFSVQLPSVVDLGVGGWFFRAAGVVATVLAVAMPMAMVIKWLRPLLKLGYGPQDIAAALRANFERKKEEYHFEHGARPTPREIALRAVSIASLAVTGGAWLSILAGASRDWLMPTAFVSGFIYPVTWMLSSRSAHKGAGDGSWWARRWEGAMGRWFTRLASIKLGARAAAADRPTEMAIAFSAQAFFEELPKAVREALGDVPGVIQQLERQARAIRTRIELLDASIADAQTGAPRSTRASTQETRTALVDELREVRSRAEERFANLVTALETTRLDLLRLRAGHGSMESITQDLHSAQALGKDIGRFLSGYAEVDAALREEGGELTPV